MTDTKLANIVLVASDENLNGAKFKRICENSCRIISETDRCVYESRAARAFRTSKLFVLCVRGVFHEFTDHKIREKVATKLFGISKDEVTGDLNVLVHSKKNHSVFVNDLRYGANVPEKKLEGLNVIWGECDLRALDDFEHVKSLNVVMGDVYTSGKTKNISKLNNLEVVTGNFYAEELEEVENLNLRYVGGAIYNNGNIYALDELKSEKMQFVKCRK